MKTKNDKFSEYIVYGENFPDIMALLGIIGIAACGNFSFV